MPAVKDVTVVGCGIAGLTSAIRLLEHFPVKIIAKDLPPDTTSDIAAAFWYPYRAYPQQLVLRWSKISLDTFYLESANKLSCVVIKKLIEVFDGPFEEPWWKELVRNFRTAAPEELPLEKRSGFVTDVPLIESGAYLRYLLERFHAGGGVVEQLDEPMAELSSVYRDRAVIVNCTGLGAFHLCGDTGMFPIRGQVLRVEAPRQDVIMLDESGLSYIVPRSADCILGGTAQDNDWNLEVDRETAVGILERCQRLSPAIAGANILADRVGLRPGRNRVRLELESVTSNCAVVHNYGHGGAGFSLSWGCAQDVLDLVLQYRSS